MKIPIFDLKKEYELLQKDIGQQIEDCLRSQQWILGQKVIKFEEDIAGYLGQKYTVGVASGTDALILALSALALKIKGKEYFDRQDEIITTPFTFIATSEAILRSGATPVFVDIDPDTFNIDPDKIKKALTKNTVGILPVHLYGLACAMDKILNIAKEHDLFVIEDVAQAFGGAFKGKKLGTWGDCGSFSFFPSKNLGGFGDGGLVATGNLKLAESIRYLRNHGEVEKYDASLLGFNSRLDSMQAAVLSVKLTAIDKFNALRREIAKEYGVGLKGLKQIQIPYLPQEVTHVYHLYTIQVSSGRDEFLDYLNSRGIESRIYYPVPLCRMKAFKKAKIAGNLTGLELVLGKILSLPIYPFLEKDKIQYIVRTIRSFFES